MFICVCFIGSTNQVIITPNCHKLVVHVGQSLNLKCNLASLRPDEFRWFTNRECKTKETITNGSKGFVVDNTPLTSNLTKNVTRLDDTGRYFCNNKDDDGYYVDVVVVQSK